MRPLSDASEDQFLKVKYVLTDIDDTLTYKGKLTARTYAALEHLETVGIKVIPVTAASAGWCDLMIRMWPVSGIIGENGGFYSVRGTGSVTRVFWLDDRDQENAARRMSELTAQVESCVPHARLAADHKFRLSSVAWERPATSADCTRLLKVILASGAHATTNSIWIMGWYGNYDKLAMARRMMSAVYGVDIDRLQHEILYVGDSLNDEPMFGHFPNSVGVSTIMEFLPELTKTPTWVTRGHGGDGFVEVARAIMAGVAGKKGEQNKPS